MKREGLTPWALLLIIVVVAALAFDFTNGFHDTANAMATSIATGALRPRVAVGLSAVSSTPSHPTTGLGHRAALIMGFIAMTKK